MPIGAIHKALRILRFMADQGMDWSIRELANMLNISRTTVHRICQVLTGEGILEFDPKTKKYHFGPELIYLAQSVYQRNEIRRLALPVLRKIVDHCNETAILGLYDSRRRQMIYTDQVQCGQPIRYHVPLGVLLPIHSGASGKAIMAFLPGKEIEKIMASDLKQVTSRTVTDPERLRCDLAEIRAKGYAITHGERTPGAVGISFPIFNSSADVIGSLTVTTPAYRFHPEMEEYIHRELSEGCEQLSRLMGFIPDATLHPAMGNISMERERATLDKGKSRATK